MWLIAINETANYRQYCCQKSLLIVTPYTPTGLADDVSTKPVAA